MQESDSPRWLALARELQAMAQTGLTYSTNDYDTTRYTRLMEIAAGIVADHSKLDAAVLADTFLEQPGYATPKVDVRGAIVRNGRILLVRERSDGLWCMPGGWADVGDYPAAMTAREVVEESGFVVEARRLAGVFDGNRSGRPMEFFHAYKLVFLCEIIGGEARPGDETSAVEFFDFDDLPPLSWERTNKRHLAEVRAHLDDPCRPAFFE